MAADAGVSERAEGAVVSALAPVPMRVAITNGKTWLVESLWARWLVSVLDRINAMTMIQTQVSTTAETAAITATDMDASIMGGLYRVSYTLNVTRAATTSSSLTATIGWTCNGVACSQAGAALTGNTTSTQQGGTVVINADANTSVTYAVAYASVGATSAQYAFSLAVESYE